MTTELKDEDFDDLELEDFDFGDSDKENQVIDKISSQIEVKLATSQSIKSKSLKRDISGEFKKEVIHADKSLPIEKSECVQKIEIKNIDPDIKNYNTYKPKIFKSGQELKVTRSSTYQCITEAEDKSMQEINPILCKLNRDNELGLKIPDSIEERKQLLKIGQALIAKLSIRTFRRCRIEYIYRDFMYVDILLIDTGRKIIRIPIKNYLWLADDPEILKIEAVAINIDFESSETIEINHECFGDVVYEIKILEILQDSSGWPRYAVENLSKKEIEINAATPSNPIKRLKTEPKQPKAEKINKKMIMFLGSSHEFPDHYLVVEHDVSKVGEITIAFREKTENHKIFRSVKLDCGALLELADYKKDIFEKVEKFEKQEDSLEKSGEANKKNYNDYHQIYTISLIGKKKRCFIYSRKNKQIFVDFQNFYFNVADSEWKRSQATQRFTMTWDQYKIISDHSSLLLLRCQNSDYENLDSSIDPQHSEFGK